jgi:hypothetical protein
VIGGTARDRVHKDLATLRKRLEDLSDFKAKQEAIHAGA